ncbi:MAG: OmpA family protein, partial [Rhodospirillaceae bacterium]|nr:OmpA family protein [Rhodospirillaceae bacterium]
MAELQPIIIKKVYKSGGGHGGGAWKIAYADFVTAMMAFFLLLWLLNSVTQEQLEGISDYFAPASISATTSGAGGVLGGKTIGEEGAMEQAASVPSAVVDLPPPKSGATDLEDSVQGDASAEALEELQKAQEEEQKVLNEAIQSVPVLKEMAESLIVENTPEGLKIQLVDQEGLAMFPSGSSNMHDHTRSLLELVATVIAQMPQQVSVSGHTDSVKFSSQNGYSNWELSADRANNARRVLGELGVPEDKFARVVGRAATEPLLPDDPTHARNRRLSIIMLRGTGKPAPEPEPEPEP